MNSLTDKIQTTDEEISEAFHALGCDADLGGDYAEPERFAACSDTLDDFRNNSHHWREHGKFETSVYVNGETIKLDSKKAIKVCDVQPKKGDQRFDLYVIDFGDIRIACKY